MRMKKCMALLCLLLLFLSSAGAEEVPPFGDFSEKFGHLFLEEGQPPVTEELTYRSRDVYIQITPLRQNRTDIYIADIYVRSTENIQRAFAGNKWKSGTEKVKTLSENNQAVLGMTGDNGHNLKAGIVIGNGKIWRRVSNGTRDICLLYRDGTMVTIEEQYLDHDGIRAQADEGLIWQCFVFGPALLDENGKAKETFNTNVRPANPRSVIGYYEPGHYCFVQVDGRGADSKLDPGNRSVGLTMNELSLLMESLGCKAAYNLDGGQSSMLYYDGDILSSPYQNGRKAGDIVFIRELEEMQFPETEEAHAN